MKEIKRISLVLFWLGIATLIAAVAFIMYAMYNPGFSFPWSDKTTYITYTIYLFTTIVLFVLSFIFGRKEREE